MTEKKMKFANVERVLNVQQDPPDIRDRYYEPTLIRLTPSMEENINPERTLDQGKEGACTGFGLAAVINHLKYKTSVDEFRASPRMLYEMAKKHDEWPGEVYEGSSCRGAIRGWDNNGVCEEKDWKYVVGQAGKLTIERALKARKNTLGAYYRMHPVISDYHAALNETGAIYVSAKVHQGWFKENLKNCTKLPDIKISQNTKGGHAFAIVGYNSRGFIVINSWSSKWGKGGYATWLYEDWIDNIMDGWVFRLALPTPQIFGHQARLFEIGKDQKLQHKKRIKRKHILGHFVHFDDGKFKEDKSLWSSRYDIKQTAKLVANHFKEKSHKHLLIYAHGGFNTPQDSAQRIHALKDVFKKNGIYPFHIMYDTGQTETIKDLVRNASGLAELRVAGFRDWIDNFIEYIVRKPGTLFWEEIKNDTKRPFIGKGDGIETIKFFIEELAKTGLSSIHLVGHSAGGVLMGHLLHSIDKMNSSGNLSNVIKSLSLMAPACTVDFYEKNYLPRLDGPKNKRVGLPILKVYNMLDKLEKKDTVVGAYNKSLLYLVSRALEKNPKKPTPLLGMEKYSKKLQHQNLKIAYSDGMKGVTRSSSHGGFDHDTFTMNDIMTTVLGRRPKRPFTEEDLKDF